MIMPALVGLTGQSGAGKSTVSDIWRDSGVSVIDCDRVAKKVTEDNSECNKELSKLFPECFGERLHLDRRKMADIVFSDKQRLKEQNDIIFKYITKCIDDILKSYDKSFIVLDAPTLFESGIYKRCRLIVSVLADEKKRFERIIARDKISADSVKLRFSSQQDNSFFIKNSDIIITNHGDFSELKSKALNALEQIKEIIYGKS